MGRGETLLLAAGPFFQLQAVTKGMPGCSSAPKQRCGNRVTSKNGARVGCEEREGLERARYRAGLASGRFPVRTPLHPHFHSSRNYEPKQRKSFH